MDSMNKILYIVITILLGGLGIHKFLSGRIVPGVVQLVLSFVFGLGALIGLIEGIYDIIKCPSKENGEIDIPKGFFDFLN